VIRWRVLNISGFPLPDTQVDAVARLSRRSFVPG
jgi:hypothetical protein